LIITLQRRREDASFVQDHSTVEPCLEILRIEFPRALVSVDRPRILVIVLESEAQVEPDFTELLVGRRFGLHVGEMFFGFKERSGLNPLEDFFQADSSRLGKRLHDDGLRRHFHFGQSRLDFFHHRKDQAGSCRDVMPRSLLRLDGGIDDDVLRLQGGQQQGDMAFKEFEPLRSGDGTGQPHGAGGGFAQRGRPCQQAGHDFVEFLLGFGPGDIAG
jgi:hypothetical protein